LSSDQVIQLAHGGGGRVSRELIERRILPAFDNPHLAELADAACLGALDGPVAFTTDTYVVQPLFFPGGDIGSLAVFGTVNDLAVVGARPLFLSCGLVIEEGFPLGRLEQVLASMRRAADRAGVSVVTGDTKVVERGGCDGLFVNTAGVGVCRADLKLGPEQIRPGDAVIVSGTVGDHEIAILDARGRLGISAAITSDCAPVAGLVDRALASGAVVRFMRDPTRGGLATVLNEAVAAAAVTIELGARAIPLADATRGACELLGLDPLYLACEGRVVVIADDGEAVVAAMREDPLGRDAVVIGTVTDARPPCVSVRTEAGGSRIVPMLSGYQLPRIC
jgi:hydrogenase expression/formation protein HypE